MFGYLVTGAQVNDLSIQSTGGENEEMAREKKSDWTMKNPFILNVNNPL